MSLKLGHYQNTDLYMHLYLYGGTLSFLHFIEVFGIMWK